MLAKLEGVCVLCLRAHHRALPSSLLHYESFNRTNIVAVSSIKSHASGLPPLVIARCPRRKDSSSPSLAIVASLARALPSSACDSVFLVFGIDVEGSAFVTRKLLPRLSRNSKLYRLCFIHLDFFVLCWFIGLVRILEERIVGMVCQAATRTAFRALKHENGIAGSTTIIIRVIACFQPLQDCQAEYFRHLLKPVT
ncbi:hypothetical protein ZIOFF_057595 [Zingiber officinale]|uniref:Uncharacterized protein n=1 Tax=Zingiber officinale TaxID=94328 RepID=A0A8J5F754_ZINOF|nr:hypothetical protein ZIOFF_057595 [Zingiber officinale]